MGEQKQDTTSSLSMNRIVIRALGLLIFIPMLGVLYLFRDELEGRWLPLVIILFLALMGFYLFWSIISSITMVIKGLEKISKGEAESVDLDQAPSQLKEMTEIINALNKLTIEFRENAAQLEKFIDQFTTLAELTEITSRIPDINELLKLVLRKAMASTHARLGTVMLKREDGSGLEIVAAMGWVPKEMGPIDAQESLCGKVIREGLPMLVKNIETHPEISRANDSSRYSSPSFLIMPLITKTGTIGAVSLSEKATGREFSDQDQQFLTVLLGQIGFAVENARLLKLARESAKQLKEAIEHKDIQLQDAQRQIIQAEKLSALGQLIAGVSHEINNPLTSVSGYAEMLLSMDNQELHSEGVKKKLQIIHGEANRATRIVENLLSFAREKKPETRTANINDIARKVVELRQYDLKTRGIELSTELNDNLPQTLLDSDQIQQVLLNLVNNSVQALNSNGPQEIKVGSGFNQEEIQLWVSDTGRGVPKAILDKIFDPFFTTKAGKTNSGLGLSISYGIINQHGGHIEVDSQEGVGTRMTIHLPIVSDSANQDKKSAQGEWSFPQVDHLSAMVVDDEERVCELVMEILENVGFKVITSNSGMEALEKLLRDDYDVVVCDVRMPHMNGMQLFDEMKNSNAPSADRFVFITGNVADPDTVQFTQDHQIPLISKPFTQQKLLQAVYETVHIEPTIKSA